MVGGEWWVWLITRVEEENLLETKTGETRGKKTRTLEDDVKQASRGRGAIYKRVKQEGRTAARNTKYP